MRVAPAFIALLFAAGCSTAPRPYAAELASPPADAAAYEATFQRCSDLVAAGRTENFRETSAGANTTGAVVAGAGGAVLVGTVAAGPALVYAGGSAAALGSAATLGVGLIVAAPFIAVHMARRARDRQEQRIVEAMDACLREHGYAAESWRVLSRNDAGTALATPTRAEP